MGDHTHRVWLVAALLVGCIADNEATEDDEGDTGGDAVTTASDGGASGGDLVQLPDTAALDGALVDAEIPDVPVPDARPPVDSAPPDAPVDDCPFACERLTECAAEICPDWDPGEPAPLVEACLAACQAQPGFAEDVTGSESCEDAIDAVRVIVPDLDVHCPFDPGDPPRHPECDVFGDRLVECLEPRCPPLAEVSERFAAAYTHLCNEGVALGNAVVEELAMFVNEETECDAPAFSAFLDRIVVDTPEDDDDGSLAAFCEHGPALDPDICVAGCELLGDCIGPDDEPGSLRNLDRCAHFCMTDAEEVDAEVWGCLAEGAECLDVGTCIVRAGPCGAYAERATQCLLELCPAAAQVEDGLFKAVAHVCSEEVEAEAWTEEAAAAVGEDTPCDDPLVAQGIAQLTVDTPEDDDDGFLVALCASGEPAESPEVCASACEQLSPCSPEDGGMRDPDICALVCASIFNLPDDVWQCVIDAAGCEAVNECVEVFQGGGPDVCGPFADLATGCVVERCAPAGPVSTGLGYVIRHLCGEEVASEAWTEEALRAAVAAAAGDEHCDDPIIAQLVELLLVDDPLVADDGWLARMCAEGPAHDGDLCDAACDDLTPCLPDDAGGLRDPDICRLVCASDFGPGGGVWQCALDAEACEEVQACLPDPPDDGGPNQ